MAAAEFVWRVPLDHPAFAGHFPGRPIVPGVLLLDHAMLLAQTRLDQQLAGWKVAQTKFLSPCGPGDELVFAFRDGARGSLLFSVQCAGRDIACGSLQAVTA